MARRFNSALHPRDSNGKFKRKGSSSIAKKSRAKSKPRVINRNKVYNNRPNTTKSAKRGSNKALIAGAVIAGAAVTAGGVYMARKHIKENALKQIHGNAYLPPTITGYHYTNQNSFRKILSTQKFVTKHRYGLPGKTNGVWFTNMANDNVGAMKAQYGDFVVKTKFARRHVMTNIEPFRNTRHRWLEVNQRHLTGRVSSHVPWKPAPGQVIRAQNLSRLRKKK